MRAPISVADFENELDATAKRMNKQTSELDVADCGCGTGSYISIVAPNVSTVVGVEPNAGMREQAAAKFARESLTNVTLKEASFDALPLEDDSVDNLMVTQVIHHLYDGENDFGPVRVALAEIARVLRPGGAFILQTQTPAQHVDGFWWAPIIPKAAATLAQRFPTVEWLEGACADAGFAGGCESVVPPEPLVNPVAYANLGGPLLETFRNADSTWALATDEELSEGLGKWREKLGSNAAEAARWCAEREDLRARVGQTTTFIARM